MQSPNTRTLMSCTNVPQFIDYINGHFIMFMILIQSLFFPFLFHLWAFLFSGPVNVGPLWCCAAVLLSLLGASLLLLSTLSFTYLPLFCSPFMHGHRTASRWRKIRSAVLYTLRRRNRFSLLLRPFLHWACAASWRMPRWTKYIQFPQLNPHRLVVIYKPVTWRRTHAPE